MNIEQAKTKLEKEKLPALIKNFNRETKNLQKLERSLLNTDIPEERETLKNYISTLKEKLQLVLDAITADKTSKANLAQLAKAFRVIADKIENGEKKPLEPNKNINLNFNVDNLSMEELLELLNKKSQEHGINE